MTQSLDRASVVARHPPPVLYLASSSSGKLREFQDAARVRGISVESVPGMESLPPRAEDGFSFEDNACKKAIHYSAWCEGRVFADDSGLSVDALGGRPGVYSARFAGPNAGDDANNARLLAALSGVPRARRTAHYFCVIALAAAGSILTVTAGRAEGIILEEPRGSGGFGYDPFFFYPPLGKTFAELGMEEKFKVSHRGEAFRKLLDYIEGRGSLNG